MTDKKNTNQNSAKSYPLKIDSQVYEALVYICKQKGITIKDGLRSAIGLLIADNIYLLSNKENEKAQ